MLDHALPADLGQMLRDLDRRLRDLEARRHDHPDYLEKSVAPWAPFYVVPSSEDVFLASSGSGYYDFPRGYVGPTVPESVDVWVQIVGHGANLGGQADYRIWFNGASADSFTVPASGKTLPEGPQVTAGWATVPISALIKRTAGQSLRFKVRTLTSGGNWMLANVGAIYYRQTI